MNTLKTNTRARAMIKKHEGLRLKVYDDGVGFMTIGYGHKLSAAENYSVIEEATAEALFEEDLKVAQGHLVRAVKVPLNQNQFGALVSWVFNLGGGALRESTMLKKLNAVELHLVPGEMMRWVIAGGRVLPGLIHRRAAEAALFIRP